MTRSYDCSDPAHRAAGLRDAAEAARRGELVVLPTDTVYGIGADASNPKAVAALLAAKGRGRHMPSPVLVDSPYALNELTADLSEAARKLVDAFWPGALTIVVAQRPSLAWDLGDTHGTVAVRMPSQSLTLELLARTGPMAVSSANLTGRPAPQDCDAAHAMLGDSVAVYLDAGPTSDTVPSSIVDVTGAIPVLRRTGALTADQLRTVLPDLVTTD
ncbi:L-threonylcarbamoyladenylate synthase [Kitasatospora sp. NPDC056076]|uniref:L-threonylcarbamoyladenylate synthase n=1 Tax=Kitasatospora sp. NPDC056076 TaxID=3345703 RepID=UPI0035D9D8B8